MVLKPAFRSREGSCDNAMNPCTRGSTVMAYKADTMTGSFLLNGC